MSMNDPISDFLTRIRNGQRARLPQISCAYAKVLENICGVLEREGYIRGHAIEDIGNNKRDLVVTLKYHDGEPAIKEIKRVSKCGRREYSAIGKLPKFFNGLGIAILSTSKGVLSDYEARQQHVGGEVLCSVF